MRKHLHRGGCGDGAYNSLPSETVLVSGLCRSKLTLLGNIGQKNLTFRNKDEIIFDVDNEYE
jgi:hypothetical protein